jgi:hypothetical protein
VFSVPGSGLFLGGLGTTHAYPRYPDEPLAFFESSESAAHEVDVTTVPFNLARLRKSGQQAVMIQLPEQTLPRLPTLFNHYHH